MKRLLAAIVGLCLIATGANSFWQSRLQVSAGSTINLSLNFATGSYTKNGVTTANFATFLSTSGSTFTNSTGGYDSCAGTLFAANTARIANGLLLYEPAATNLQLGSQFVTGWGTSAATQTANNAVAPDGTTTASTIVESATNASHGNFSNNNITASLTSYVISGFTKRGVGSRNTSIDVVDRSTFSQNAWVNTDLTGVSVNGSSAGAGAGWSTPTFFITTCGSFFRFGMVVTVNSTVLVPSFNVNFYMNNTSGVAIPTSYLGDGTSSLILYGAQVEVGTAVSSYFPTTSASATRATDALTISVPSPLSTLTITFDDNSTQVIGSATGSYLLPTSINRSQIKSMVWS